MTPPECGFHFRKMIEQNIEHSYILVDDITPTTNKWNPTVPNSKPFSNLGRQIFSQQDKVLSAEILWALKTVKSNFSFASNDGNNQIFAAMFPDSNIVTDYQMSQTKCKYLIQFGIYPWIKEQMLLDLKGNPFSYKFDETTTIQVKKQYDAYVQFESKCFGDIVNWYCGSLFLGHCKAVDLKDHFFEFGRKLTWDIDFLLQIEMDGPNLNLLFHKLLTKELLENNDKTIIDIGTCGLHNIHNGFSVALKELGFDFDGFAHDLWFFFKNSSARREDYKLTELITEVESAIVLRHVSSRWLTLKKVLIRIIGQWENLKEYFLKFLPTQKGFKKNIETTARYQSIKKYLTSKTSLLYMSFAVYVADMLEEFLILFQSSKPLVHILYVSISDLFFKILSNFVKQPVLMDAGNVRKDAKQLSEVDLSDKSNLKSLHDINFGHKAAYQIGLVESNTNLDIIKTEFKICYNVLMEYLKKHLPYKYSILADLQYLHRSKRLDERGVPAIRRIAGKMYTVLKRSKYTGFTDIDRYYFYQGRS